MEDVVGTWELWTDMGDMGDIDGAQREQGGDMEETQRGQEGHGGDVEGTQRGHKGSMERTWRGHRWDWRGSESDMEVTLMRQGVTQMDVKVTGR